MLIMNYLFHSSKISIVNLPSNSIPSYSIKLCESRTKNLPILTTPNKMESFVCSMSNKSNHPIDDRIAQARITKSTFNKLNHRPPSQPTSHSSTNNKSRPNIDIRCQVCGLTNRDLFKQITRLHSCKDQNCPFRGPSFISNKQMRETVQQFNVRNGERPKKVIIDPSFSKDPPIKPHIPQIKAISDPNLDSSSNTNEIPCNFDDDELDKLLDEANDIYHDTQEAPIDHQDDTIHPHISSVNQSTI